MDPIRASSYGASDGRRTKDAKDKVERVEDKYRNDEIRNQNDEQSSKQLAKGRRLKIKLMPDTGCSILDAG